MEYPRPDRLKHDLKARRGATASPPRRRTRSPPRTPLPRMPTAAYVLGRALCNKCLVGLLVERREPDRLVLRTEHVAEPRRRLDDDNGSLAALRVDARDPETISGMPDDL